jgi:hypothetical protein
LIQKELYPGVMLRRYEKPGYPAVYTKPGGAIQVRVYLILLAVYR